MASGEHTRPAARGSSAHQHEGLRALGLELKHTEPQKREKGEQRTSEINKNQIAR